MILQRLPLNLALMAPGTVSGAGLCLRYPVLTTPDKLRRGVSFLSVYLSSAGKLESLPYFKFPDFNYGFS